MLWRNLDSVSLAMFNISLAELLFMTNASLREFMKLNLIMSMPEHFGIISSGRPL